MSDSDRNITHYPDQHSSGLYLLTPLFGSSKRNVTGDMCHTEDEWKQTRISSIASCFTLTLNRLDRNHNSTWISEKKRIKNEGEKNWLDGYSHALTHRNSIRIMHPSLCFSCLPFPFLSAIIHKLEFIQSQYITPHISLIICMINLMNLRQVLSKSRKTSRSDLHW